MPKKQIEAEPETQFASLISNIMGAVEEGPEFFVADKNSRGLTKRREYAGRPQAYFHEVLGWYLTPQQEEVLSVIEEYDRVLVPSGNNTGKTFILGGYAVYRFDAVASLPDEDRDLAEQGAQILLPGPDHNTIFNTIYASILEHAQRAEDRGFDLPGERSERSVNWRVRPRWHFEAFAPSFRVGQAIAHSASGRHHKNQVAIIEEGQGVEEALWKAAEGMCSSHGNKIISAFNPSDPAGPAYQRALRGGYKVIHMTAFEHPNVRGRTVVVPDAISYRVIDERVKVECRDRGAHTNTVPDADMNDFVYALPPSLDSEEIGAREDGELGHPLGQLRVYRPTMQFEAQVLGQWPKSGNRGLFDPGAWDAAVTRWQADRDPTIEPDAVGVDVARTGEDETCAAPMWGEDQDMLLRDWAEAQHDHDEVAKDILLKKRRIRVGNIVTIQKGDGPFVAQALCNMWVDATFYVDETGVGSSVLDHLTHVMNVDAVGVSGAAAVKDLIPGEPVFENARAAMYHRAAELVRIGLVDVPDDPILREELMVQEVVHSARVVKFPGGKRERKPSIRIIEKKEIKKKIGRSPDRADAFVLSLFRLEREPKWDIL